MGPIKARVENGYLIVREPTDLPEGTVMELRPSDDWDDLDDEERAALHASLERGLAELKAGGPTYSWEEVLEKLQRNR